MDAPKCRLCQQRHWGLCDEAAAVKRSAPAKAPAPSHDSEAHLRVAGSRIRPRTGEAGLPKHSEGLQTADQQPDGPVAVYRCFDATGALLYVGQSISPLGRLIDEHSRRFAGMIATVLISWHPDKDAALLAEREAIASEAPAYNRSPGNLRRDLPSFRSGDGKFDRTAYQKAYMREYMRKKRAAAKT